ncbi:MAG: hypothetical protein P8Z30_08310, partial [Acidobacteriota bacterium]
MAAGILLLGLAKPCAAQSSYIEGISEIIPSSDGSLVYTWSETYVTPDLAAYYEAYVEGYVYQNGNGPVAEGSELGNPYWNDAVVEMEGTVSDGSDYELISNHGVAAYYIYYVNGTEYYYNPYGFAFTSGSQPGSTDFAPYEGGSIYITAELIYLGSTAVEMSAAPPSISGVSPSGAAVESSGTITVTGSNLLNVCSGSTSASISGSGTTLTVGSVSQDGTQAVLNYSIAANASTGSQTLTLTTCFGSGSASFQVGDPTPVITGVSPNKWPAGSETSFIISGSGFGTAPTLSVTGNGVTGSAISSSTDTQISATVNVAANAPSGIATITVTSTGYLGNGFVSTAGGGGSTNSATANASINATQAPAPTIVWGPDSGDGANCGGSNIANTPQNPLPVVVGQQIAFTACFPQGVTITSETWSPTVPAGTVVSGYNASTTGGCVVTFGNYGSTDCDKPASTGAVCGTANYCDFPTFYWVDTGGNGSTFTIKYTYTLSGTTYTGSASLTFSVSGPTNVEVSTTASGVIIYPPPNNTQHYEDIPLLINGAPSVPSPGMNFVASSTLPSGDQGSYEWVQTITHDVSRYLTQSGPTPPSDSVSGGPALDTTYPYGFNADGTPYSNPNTVTSTNAPND